MDGAEKIEIVTCCTKRDMKTLLLVVKRLRKHFSVKKIVVIVPGVDLKKFRRKLRDQAEVRSEDEVIPEMTFRQLSEHPGGLFPKMTGWYYQQFLKFSYAYENINDDYYLIWDADTVPLRKIDLFDGEGRMIFTPSEEYHAPYFETYRRLTGEDARREFSFISQYQIVQKSVLREMLAQVSERFPDERGWAWSLVRGLPDNLPLGNYFSEYETYGHYLKNHYPERMVLRNTPWFRDGTETYGFPPDERLLSELGGRYAYVAFESRTTGLSRVKRQVCKCARYMKGIFAGDENA